MSEFDEFKAIYFDECAELLVALEEQFTAIEAGERGADRLNAAFRAVHSIKGGAGAFGFSALIGFAHAYETLMDQVRAGRVALTPEAVGLCIRANDALADFVAAARSDTLPPPGRGEAEIAGFEALMRGDGAAGAAEASAEPVEAAEDFEFDLDFVPVMVDVEARRGSPGTASAVLVHDGFEESPLGLAPNHFEIRFVPHEALYRRANDPLLLLRELETLGETHVRAVIEEIPPLDEFEPFGVYAGWEISLTSARASEAEIAEVFEFVEGLCALDIVRLCAPLSEEAADAAFAAAEPSFAALAEGLAPAPRAEQAVVAPIAEPAAEPAARESERGEAERRTMASIRVDLDKVDRVVNMVGELVITQSMLNQQMDETLRRNYQELVRGLEVLAQTTRGLQDAVMAIRAQPVKSVFSRMPRLVRDLVARTGKAIRLEMAGEATEIDKTVIEQIADPLIHMIRNSADHGIERQEARLAAGKPAHGTIRLSAQQAGGSILIAVEDDGAGIDRARVLELGRERGLVGPDQQLTNEEIDALIFAPGFSTAEIVSDISGRGVGMDVVRANIDRIGGSVDVRSWPGRGTRMTLRLPLTLAVLDVMLVRLGSAPYVVPLSSIVETLQCARGEFGMGPSGARMLRVRGDYVQVIDVADIFGAQSGTPFAQRFIVLCEADRDSRVALVVDEIVGQQQVVIKSLEENYGRVEGIAGGTILGDGSVGLIVDVEGLRAMAGRRRAA